jgi:hypothetical protein
LHYEALKSLSSYPRGYPSVLDEVLVGLDAYALFVDSATKVGRLLHGTRVEKEVTQLSDFFVTTTISLHAKFLSHRDVLFFILYGVCRLPLVKCEVKCKLRTIIYTIDMG